MKSRRRALRVSTQEYADIQVLSDWLLKNVPTVESKRMADGFAALVVTAKNYDRNQPVRDNAIGGYEFDLPAPDSLKG